MKKIAVFIAIIFSMVAVFAQTKQLDEKSAFYIYIKGSNTVLSADDEVNYARSFEEATYKKYKNDEFEWDEQFSIIKQNLKKQVEEADMDSTYIIGTTLEFGDYDFTNEGFPITISAGTFFPFNYFNNWYDYKRTSLLHKRMALKLDSFEKFNFFAMPKDEAKTFLQGRKNSYGNVNRKVALQIYYKIAAFDSDEYNCFKDLALSNDYLPLVGIIEKIEVYDMANPKSIKKISELVQK